MEELITAFDWFGPTEFYVIIKMVMIFLGLWFFSLLIRAGIVQMLILGPLMLYWNRKDKKKMLEEERTRKESIEEDEY